MPAGVDLCKTFNANRDTLSAYDTADWSLPGLGTASCTTCCSKTDDSTQTSPIRWHRRQKKLPTHKAHQGSEAGDEDAEITHTWWNRQWLTSIFTVTGTCDKLLVRRSVLGRHSVLINSTRTSRRTPFPLRRKMKQKKRDEPSWTSFRWRTLEETTQLPFGACNTSTCDERRFKFSSGSRHWRCLNPGAPFPCGLPYVTVTSSSRRTTLWSNFGNGQQR